MSEPLKVFITYSHNDRQQNTELKTRLAVMESEGKVRLWDDNEILPGDEWYKDISTNLAASDILLYLVSAYSLASENCNKELAEALSSEIRVIPIILESCDWLNHQLSDFQSLPDKGQPINKWQPESDGWQNVVDGIRKAVEEMQAQADSLSGVSKEELLSDSVFHQGNFLLILGQIDRAIEAYSYAIELNPNNPAAYNNRGVSYDSKEKYDRAIADFNTAIQLKPNLAEAYSNRGAAYNKQDDFDRAIADFNTAIQLKSNLAEAYSNRGNAYNGKEEYDRAIEDCNRAIQLKPDYADAYVNRGNAYNGKGEYERVIADFNTVIQLKPNLVEAYFNRGNAYNSKGEIDRAIEDFNTAIQLKPDFAEAYINRGIAYGSKDYYERAIADFNTAIQRKPNLTQAYNNRGAAYYQQGDFDRAIEDYDTAIQLKPDYGNAYYNRGETWLHLEEWDKARMDLTIAKDMEIDIIAAFHNDYKSVEAYERGNRVKLPEDIATMLTQRRRSRFPKMEKFLSADGTPLESPDVLNLLAKLRDAGTSLSQYIQASPTFGLKTGRQETFVVDSTIRDRLIAEHPSSADILKPFLRGRDIRRWQVARPDSWLIFTYRRIEINHYPAIRKHLEKYRSSLSKRAGKQKWYELPASKSDAELFTQTKLICPNLYDHQTFAVDTDGFYCGDTCYLIPTEETWLCGLLNSRIVEWFYWQVSNQSTGDDLRARSGYMRQIPIPDLSSTQKAVIGKIVDYLIYLQGQPTTNSGDLAHARDAVMLKYFERIIDGLVYEAYLGEELHHGGKQFFKPLLDERLPQLEEIRGDKMFALQEIFERLYERTHPVRRNLFFLDSVKLIRIVEDRT